MSKHLRIISLLFFVFFSVVTACAPPSTVEPNSNSSDKSFKVKNFDSFSSMRTLSIVHTRKTKTDHYITWYLPEGGSGSCLYETTEETEFLNNRYISFRYLPNDKKWHVSYNYNEYYFPESGGSFSKSESTPGLESYTGSLTVSGRNVNLKLNGKIEYTHSWGSNYSSDPSAFSDKCPRPPGVYYYYQAKNYTVTTDIPFDENFPLDPSDPGPEPTPTPTLDPTPEPTPTISVSPSVDPEPSWWDPSATPSSSPSNTPTPTSSPTINPSDRPSPNPTIDPSSTPNPRFTPNPNRTSKPEPTPKPKPTATPRACGFVLPDVSNVLLTLPEISNQAISDLNIFDNTIASLETEGDFSFSTSATNNKINNLKTKANNKYFDVMDDLSYLQNKITLLSSYILSKYGNIPSVPNLVNQDINNVILNLENNFKSTKKDYLLTIGMTNS